MPSPTETPDEGPHQYPAGQDSDTEAAILKSDILIVDDQAAHVHLLERLLRETGYVNVSATLDPRQVVGLHRKHRYDLILLDLQMPGLDGFGVMEELRTDMVSIYLPVIVLTAQPAHKLRALQAGARDFICKPFETVEVTVRIHHMLELRLLHKKLEAHNRELERAVQERTAELQESEARYRSLTELAVDWYWEQNDAGTFTTASGPIMELLGMADATFAVDSGDEGRDVNLVHAPDDRTGVDHAPNGADNWDAGERQTLKDYIGARRPFLDLLMHRRRADGSQQVFRISGEPMFDRTCRFAGYRGLGVEVRTGL
jgi:CheY-like chemotaxis protein